MKRFIAVVVILVVLFANSIFAQLLSIQGVARDSEGQSLPDGSYTFTFRLYDAEIGGTLKWNENQTLDVLNGVFSANLGEVQSMSGLDFNTEYWLSIEIGSNGELSPRSKLTLTPYAAMAQIDGTSNVFPEAGNVGIGTISPDYKLHVEGQIYASNGLKVPSSGTVIENSNNGRAIMQTGWLDTYGDYTAINSGYDWDASHEPVSMMASYNGFYVTKAIESGVPFGKILYQVTNTGDVAHTGNLICKGLNYESTWMRFKEHSYGNALYIGSGGVAAIGAGESVTKVYDNVDADEENLYLTADAGVKIVTNLQSGWDSRKEAITIEADADINILGGKPIEVKTFTKENDETVDWDTGYYYDTWSAMVVGYNYGYCDIDEDGAEGSWKVIMVKNTTDRKWHLTTEGHTHNNHPDWTVHVMFIKKQLVNDFR